MLIYAVDDTDVVHAADDKTLNWFSGIPEGTRIKCLIMRTGRAGNVEVRKENCDFVADGSEMLVSLSAIRRIRAQARAA